MTKKEVHDYTLMLIQEFGVSISEIARMASIERTNLSRWLNHYETTNMRPDRLQRLQATVLAIAYGANQMNEMHLQLTNIML